MPTNTSQDTAEALAGSCDIATISNVGAATTPAASDPLNTVYGLGTYARQVWYKLTNTSTEQAYTRFTVTNPEASQVDLAAAIYLDDPATVPVVPARGYAGENNNTLELLPAGGSFTLGTAINPGQTVWLELGGDDLEGDGDGWNGDLTLEWQLLTATFYDTPDQGYEGTTEFVAAEVATLAASGNFLTATSYCRLGDLNFASYYENSTDQLSVWVWTDGGAATSYPINADGVTLSHVLATSFGDTDGYGPVVPLLRSDGTNVWLVHYANGPGANPCGSGTVNIGKVAVWRWNGAGFTLLGAQASKVYPNNTPNYGAGRLTAAACPAEPGVLHVMWSEAGPQSCAFDANGFSTQFLQRIAYSRWSTSAMVTDADVSTDLGSLAADGTYIGTPLITNYLLITNAFGGPVAFYGAPATQNMLTFGEAGSITYGSVIDVWSVNESTGATTLLQTADAATLIGAGTVLTAPAAGHMQPTIYGTQWSPQQQYASKNTIFFSADWNPTQAVLLAVPVDGSSAVVVAQAGGANIHVLDSGDTGNVVDVYDDGTNIWWSGAGIIGQQSLECPLMPEGGGYDGHLAGNGLFIWADAMEAFYDSTVDAFYTLGCDHSSSAPNNYAPLKIPILRDYLVCGIGSCVPALGARIWQHF